MTESLPPDKVKGLKRKLLGFCGTRIVVSSNELYVATRKAQIDNNNMSYFDDFVGSYQTGFFGKRQGVLRIVKVNDLFDSTRYDVSFKNVE